MRKFLCGDIHGYAGSLLFLLNLVEFDYEEDKLIQIGDLGDRGPNTYEVLEILLKIKKLILIQGNHDIWFKQWLNKANFDFYQWIRNGGNATIHSYDGKEKEKHFALLNKQVPYYIDDKNRCFVHGGFDRNVLVEKQDDFTLAWDRTLIREMMTCKKNKILKTKNNFKEVFIGHTPTIIYTTKEVETGVLTGIICNTADRVTIPIHKGGMWNIDTGCGKGGLLSLMNIDTKEIWQSIEIN
jgi:serine/threonine protein phosphatase 1